LQSDPRAFGHLRKPLNSDHIPAIRLD